MPIRGGEYENNNERERVMTLEKVTGPVGGTHYMEVATGRVYAVKGREVVCMTVQHAKNPGAGREQRTQPACEGGYLGPHTCVPLTAMGMEYVRLKGECRKTCANLGDPDLNRYIVNRELDKRPLITWTSDVVYSDLYRVLRRSALTQRVGRGPNRGLPSFLLVSNTPEFVEDENEEADIDNDVAALLHDMAPLHFAPPANSTALENPPDAGDGIANNESERAPATIHEGSTAPEPPPHAVGDPEQEISLTLTVNELRTLGAACQVISGAIQRNLDRL